MRPPSRRAVVYLLLGLFVAWPFAQHGLSRAAEVHPWRLFGFGMYSTYYFARPRVTVLGDGAPLEAADDGSGLAGEIREFSRRRAVLGTLVSEERFARRVLERRTDADEVRIEIERRRLDPETARVAVERRQRSYRRESR